jgi:hypothetical protein
MLGRVSLGPLEPAFSVMFFVIPPAATLFRLRYLHHPRLLE